MPTPTKSNQRLTINEMGLPGKRLSRSSKRRRAAHFALAAASVTTCPRCHSPRRPHRACASCGFYRSHATTRPQTKRTRAAKAKA